MKIFQLFTFLATASLLVSAAPQSQKHMGTLQQLTTQRNTNRPCKANANTDCLIPSTGNIYPNEIYDGSANQEPVVPAEW
jgi:hypothetical protein